MKIHWADRFREQAIANGINCSIIRTSNGWIETMLIDDSRCFVKSTTYNADRSQYFQGVDTAKLNEQGDYVVLCGGEDGELRDIFIMPWSIFFNNLRTAPAIGTYKDHDYQQYKFHVRYREGTWLIKFERGNQFDVGESHYDLPSAINFFKTVKSLKAIDLPVPPDEAGRQQAQINRIIRDTKLTLQIKQLYNYCCQLCGYHIDFEDGRRYAETHHIRPLGSPHNGPDSRDNILCVCPNCHAKLDFGIIKLDSSTVNSDIDHHPIRDEYIEYHNLNIYRKI